MADGKNNILVYRDWIHQFEKLTDEEAGQLIKHFFNYVNDKNPEPPNRLIEICFEPIKQTLKRDLHKWELTLVGKSKAGLASAEKRKQNQHVLTPVESVEQNPTHSTDRDKDSVNDNVTVKDSESEHAQFPIFEKFIFELTETEINAAKEINCRQTGQFPTEKDIGNWLYIFKQVNFTGQKFYENRGEIVKHFKNWVKSQKLQSHGNTTNNYAGANGTAKKGTSEARTDRAKTW
jgi:hypothetical protein